MTQHCFNDSKLYEGSASSSPYPLSSQHRQISSLSHKNIFRLLSWREISPRARYSSKRLHGDAKKFGTDCIGSKCEIIDARLALNSWVEAKSLHHLSAKYCSLVPPPRSTIAAAFSLDGKTLASTHGDHTVKIIDCQTGRCLKVLSGHRRTPWVVRFHPLYSEILASGSLDHEVRLWDANSAVCIGSHDFYRPIASIAFHAQGELLAVASGHKLFIWNYKRDTSSPSIVLKTRRSLRAVHFHPHAAPFLLTAEVNDLDSPDSPLALATSCGYSPYPPPAVFFANINSRLCPHLEANMPLIPSPYLFWPTIVRDDARSSLQLGGRVSSLGNVQQQTDISRQLHANGESQFTNLVTPMEMSPGEPSSTSLSAEDALANSMIAEMETAPLNSYRVGAGTSHVLPTSRYQQERSSGIAGRPNTVENISSTSQANSMGVQMPTGYSRQLIDGAAVSSYNPSFGSDLQVLLRNVEGGQVHQIVPISDPSRWELPFLQGWLMGQTHAGLNNVLPVNSSLQGDPSMGQGTSTDLLTSHLQYRRNMEALLSSSNMRTTVSQSRGSGRSGSRHRSRSHMMASTGSGEGALVLNSQDGETEPHSGRTGIGSEIPATLPSVAAAELPCTVKLRIWPHDMRVPCATLNPDKCRLTIPHAVLCSEMGAHFSPCGRFFVACVACMLPQVEGDPGLQAHMPHDAAGARASPTRHPISAHQVMYELRVYSLEGATFGKVLASRAIRAAHCLTSIQFSPTSEHILLAYGRRHSSLLRSIIIDEETAIPIYTILEVYRVSDMELVRVLPSAEDEVNVACFHPLVGGGLVYGTKEGKLRILKFDGSQDANCTGTNFFLEESILESQV
ncbi:uncharacterized protein LOC109850131 isoform X2 [Asparagus officinalis]|uniref:uncharacterized protein LOC109850131 isoform X2 n=1 Tax=Asparagus officinalis TaxID=4686 RepID=UPI00098E2100|nr:uncharacterized protein LOC109850131 isoform X2 [Asparagus officinalis]